MDMKCTSFGFKQQFSLTCVIYYIILYYIISLFLEFFHQLVFPCRHACSSETHGTIPTSLLVFVENVFTSLVSLLFLECKLHCGTCSLALKKRLC